MERYYRIQYKIEEDKPLEYWEEQIQKEFEESVAMHQIADVEVGCFLSSGVDSSYVVREISKGHGKGEDLLRGLHRGEVQRAALRPEVLSDHWGGEHLQQGQRR